jgi:isoquinoline 1-oxidoreductase beta subunit
MTDATPDAPPPRNIRRRVFLIGAAVVGGALSIGVYRFYRPRDRLRPPAALRSNAGEAVLTAWIRLGTDGQVTVQVPRQEMGQGIASTLALIVAEEMDADPARVRFEEAPVEAVYGNATVLGDGVPFRPDDKGIVARFSRFSQLKLGEALGVQATGGSTSVRDAWRPMREAGATARAMLLQAAAARLAVPTDTLSVRNGVIEHKASGKRATFGELALDAGKLPLPRDVPVRDPERFVLLGKPQRRLDIPPKVDGSARFGIDVRMPGLCYAAIAQCPVFGGTLASFDATRARQRRNIVDIFDIPATSTSAAAVVVVARHYWEARAALADIDIKWNDGPNAKFDTAAQRERYEALLEHGDGRVYDRAGNVAQAAAGAAQQLTADYFVPYLAHATMEPINCTAVVRIAGTCEVWVGNQAPTLVKWYAARAAELDSDKVTVHTPYLGGGFGRRFEVDVVMQAVMIARRLPDTPVQLIWSREEDMTHDVYRPMAAARFRAALASDGSIVSWYNKIVGQSCTGSLAARLLPAAASDLLKDKTTAEGAFDLPYVLPNRVVEHVLTHEPVPVGYWRSVGHSYNAFFTESFVDECAAAAGQDPVVYRLTLLRHAPRVRKVLELAAEKAGWDTPPPPRVGRGVAVAVSFHSIVAQVAEVEIVAGAPRVRRVVCAVDCGFAVNPEIVTAQMESGIIFGLTAALHGEITLKGGRVEQSNFPSYEMVRLANTPAIEVHIVSSGLEHLGGIGEPGTPPIAPAVCNALFRLTGKRIRSLPIRL